MIQIWESIKTWQNHRARVPHGTRIGFVPTMGALHEGHASLMKKSIAENDLTVVSVFVNPTQFDRTDDLKNYPKTWTQDLELLKSLDVHHVLLPTAAELYQDGYRYRVTEKEKSLNLCGAHRPGHFDGVLTVVMKLLNLVQADSAYFGEKDFQQLTLVREMAESFFMKTKIVGCPIVREADGLAMSSRNLRLSASEREKAPVFAKILSQSAHATEAANLLRQEGFEVDYVTDWEGRRLGAVQLGKVRLIDNVALRNGNNGSANG